MAYINSISFVFLKNLDSNSDTIYNYLDTNSGSMCLVCGRRGMPGAERGWVRCVDGNIAGALVAHVVAGRACAARDRPAARHQACAARHGSLQGHRAPALRHDRGQHHATTALVVGSLPVSHKT